MPSFDIAHIQEQGNYLIIVPVADSFEYQSVEDQVDIMEELQMHARSAGLLGEVVAVWRSGRRMMYMGPPHWQDLLRSLSMDLVSANVNKTLSW